MKVKPTVQLSLDVLRLEDALEAAEVAVRAGVDWLEAGTPLIVAEGQRCVRELHARHPNVPIVADLKMMDGGAGSTELMVRAGASMVVVMGQAHPETVERSVETAHDLDAKVMGDNMAMPDPVDGARRLEDLGCDYIVHHIGYDMRTLRKQRRLSVPTPLDRLREVVEAVFVPVQAVGGLTVQEAIATPKLGAPLVVIGAPLVIQGHAFRSASGDIEEMLRTICEKVHAYGEIDVARNPAALGWRVQ